MSIAVDHKPRSGILPPPDLEQEFLGAQFFFDYIFYNPVTQETDINYFLTMSSEKRRLLNLQMHQEAAPYVDSIERHTHISDYWSAIGQYFARLASKDGLTGLFNKLAFEDTFEKTLKKYNQTNDLSEKRSNPALANLSLVNIDLNRFKPVNDILGHSFGNDVLIGVSSVLADTIRLQDTAGRLGGDEFSLLLVGADYDAAQNIGQRINQTLTQTRFLIPADKTITLSDKNLEILGLDLKDNWIAADLTPEQFKKLKLNVEKIGDELYMTADVSIGICEIEKGMGALKIEERADQDMYADKNRNHSLWSYDR